MSSTRTFDPELISLMDATDEIVIETIRASGEPRQTVIWIVSDGADAYIRSVNGPRGRWLQDVVAQPEAMITIGGERIPVEAVPAADDATVELVNDLLRAKYGHRSRASTASMLQPETLETTLRLDPA